MAISKRKRFLVFDRDGNACVYCGRRAPSVTLEVDHRTPRSAGGSDDMSNLVSACWDCNRGKGALIRIGSEYERSQGFEDWQEDQLCNEPYEYPTDDPSIFLKFPRRRHHVSRSVDWVGIASHHATPAAFDWTMTTAKVLALAEAFDVVEVL